MRQVKGRRKLRQINFRQQIHLHLRTIFASTFANHQGMPQEKLEAACGAVDRELEKSIRLAPQEIGFYKLVEQDFRTFLEGLEKNSKMIEEATLKEPDQSKVIIESSEYVKTNA